MKKTNTIICINDEWYRAITSKSNYYRLQGDSLEINIKYSNKRANKSIVLTRADDYECSSLEEKLVHTLLTYDEILTLDLLFSMYLNEVCFDENGFFKIPCEFIEEHKKEIESLGNINLCLAVSKSKKIDHKLVERGESNNTISLGEFAEYIRKRGRYSNIDIKYINMKRFNISIYQVMKYLNAMLWINRKNNDTWKISILSLLQNIIVWDDKGRNTNMNCLDYIKSHNANSTNVYKRILNMLERIFDDYRTRPYIENIKIEGSNALKDVENVNVIVQFCKINNK